MKKKIQILLLIWINFTSFSTTHTIHDIPTLFPASKSTHKKDHEILKGKIKINGFQWETVCDCQPKKQKMHESKEQKCNPSMLKIFKDKSGNGLKYKQIRRKIGRVKGLKWTKVSKKSFSCVDGRVSNLDLSTPGGDAGEFLLALHTYQNYFGTRMKLDDDAVDRIFRRYLKSMKQKTFRMCSDDQAISHIEKELTMIGIDLENPRSTIQERLLKALMKPVNTGDLHLKLMLTKPKMYTIDESLIKMFMKSFYNNLWNNPKLKKKIKLEILVGKHTERAFVEIKSNPICTKDDVAPLIRQRGKKNSIFVNHLDAVQIRRAQLAYFFANVINMHQDPIDTDKLFDRINQEGMSFLEITGSYIGKELPFYSINIL